MPAAIGASPRTTRFLPRLPGAAGRVIVYRAAERLVGRQPPVLMRARRAVGLPRIPRALSARRPGGRPAVRLAACGLHGARLGPSRAQQRSQPPLPLRHKYQLRLDVATDMATTPSPGESAHCAIRSNCRLVMVGGAGAMEQSRDREQRPLLLFCPDCRPASLKGETESTQRRCSGPSVTATRRLNC